MTSFTKPNQVGNVMVSVTPLSFEAQPITFWANHILKSAKAKFQLSFLLFGFQFDRPKAYLKQLK